MEKRLFAKRPYLKNRKNDTELIKMMATVIQKARVLALSWVSKGTFTFIPINPPMIVAGRHAMEKMVKRRRERQRRRGRWDEDKGCHILFFLFFLAVL